MNHKKQWRCVSVLIVFFSAGCTMNGGDVAAKDRNKVLSCKDMRDGEVFKFNTNTMRNIRVGIGASSGFDMTTLDGKEMTLNSGMEAWLKCEALEVNHGKP